MADLEPRRSGRANKGHHTKNLDDFDEASPAAKTKPTAAPKAKSTGAKSTPARSVSAQTPEQQEEEDDAVIRCVCGVQRDIKGRQMIACEMCDVWQHVKCLGLSEGPEWESRTYYCEQCKPELHAALLEAMARGEKPWNRKKGAKGKLRPSDVWSEMDSKADTSSPVSQQAPTAVAAAPPTSSAEPPKEDSNGHDLPVKAIKAEAKQPSKPDTKIGTQSTQPKSPVGEKRRRETVSEKDGMDTKRRKSSSKQGKTADATGPAATDPAALPANRKQMVEVVTKYLAPKIRDAVQARKYRIPDGDTTVTLGNRLAMDIDHAMVANHGPPKGNDSAYTLKTRSIMFNMDKNLLLLDRLLSGSLAANELTVMSSEEMASEDKQREYAALREENDKQVVLTEEKGPRVRKTHKGEELIEDDERPHRGDESFSVPERHHRESMQTDHTAGGDESPRDGSPMQVELPEDIGRSIPLAVDTSAASPSGAAARHPSSAFDVKKIWEHARSPDEATQTLHRRQSSIAQVQQQPQGPGDDADIDRLLKDEDDDDSHFKSFGYSGDTTICWQGSINMPAAGPFQAVARLVAGADVGQKIPWTQMLPADITITGRIDYEKGDEYVAGMRGSATSDVAVLSVSPVNADGRARLDRLFEYFHSRGRWGVVPSDKLGHEAARDLYVVPVPAGGGSLPPFLDMLEYCTIETPRSENLLLLALIARTQSPNATPGGHPIADGTYTHPMGAAPNAPPQMSPMPGAHPQFPPNANANFPPGGNYGSPYPPAMQSFGPPPHHANRLAVDIFGPYIDAPVTITMLQQPDIGEIQMRSLRAIMDAEPAARTDMTMLQQHLARNGVA
ncbi:hypothetical protein BU16DRAFT_582424 [Lophium mytilinum]|uniref:Transcription factor BYE1 n=1 Tax=Lophium mytilinum TaxID=390894 RepID=A0A6A6QQT8_9PEZI|nr:hypothetical protein BU16DRAFT_582424 [Lophium mytilinum]